MSYISTDVIVRAILERDKDWLKRLYEKLKFEKEKIIGYLEKNYGIRELRNELDTAARYGMIFSDLCIVEVALELLKKENTKQ